MQDAHALVDPIGAPDVKAASPVVTTTATATRGQTSYDISSVVGTEPAYFTTTNKEITDGVRVGSGAHQAGRDAERPRTAGWANRPA